MIVMVVLIMGVAMFLSSFKGEKCVIYHHFWAQDEAPQLVREGVELASPGSLAPSFHRIHAYERVEQLIDVFELHFRIFYLSDQ